MWLRAALLLIILSAVPAGAQTPVINQAERAVAITPANGVAFTATKGLFTAGTTTVAATTAACALSMKLKNDQALVTYNNILPGVVYPYEVVDIEATNTTCVGIVGLYYGPVQ